MPPCSPAQYKYIHESHRIFLPDPPAQPIGHTICSLSRLSSFGYWIVLERVTNDRSYFEHNTCSALVSHSLFFLRQTYIWFYTCSGLINADNWVVGDNMLLTEHHSCFLLAPIIVICHFFHLMIYIVHQFYCFVWLTPPIFIKKLETDHENEESCPKWIWVD